MTSKDQTEWAERKKAEVNLEKEGEGEEELMVECVFDLILFWELD